MYFAVLQSLYLLWAIRGLGLAWARGGRGANLATMTLVIGLYFWAMTIVVCSLLRYMVSVMALLFIFCAVAISRGEDVSTIRPAGQGVSAQGSERDLRPPRQVERKRTASTFP